MANWLDDQLRTIYDPVPEDPSIDDEPSTPLRHPIDEAMNKLVHAVAAFHRAGPHYSRKSEAFRIFAAGTWDQRLYDQRILEAGQRLPKRRNVHQDILFAEAEVEEAVRLLKRSGLEEDARDLSWALKQYRKGGFPL